MRLFLSPTGNDSWSGRLPEANSERNDGPLATLGKARDVVRQMKLAGRLDGPVTVWLRGGRYLLTEPVVFGVDDSGPITYAAFEKEKPIIDGGVSISDWTVDVVGGVTRWVADLPDVAAGRWYFRSLFVNGQRRQRARLPKQGFYWMENVPGTTWTSALFDGSDTFQCAPGDIREWRNLSDVDIVAFHYWVEERMPIASFEAATNTVVSSRKSIFALKDDVAQRFARYFVENVFEALSEPGEWYLDRNAGKLYYIPMPGETPQTAQVFAPRCRQLLKLVGKAEAEKYVEYLRFVGSDIRA